MSTTAEHPSSSTRDSRTAGPPIAEARPRSLRAGVWLIPIAGLLFAVGYGIAGPFLQFDTDPQRFAEIITAPTFAGGMLLNALALIALLFGFAALHHHLSATGLRRRSFTAATISVLGTGLLLAALGMVFALPAIGDAYLAGQTEALDIATTIFESSLAGPVMLLGNLLFAAGPILFATVIWRTGTLPNGAGLLLAVSAATFALVIFVPDPQLAYATDVTAGLLMLTGGSWLATASATSPHHRSLNG